MSDFPATPDQSGEMSAADKAKMDASNPRVQIGAGSTTVAASSEVVVLADQTIEAGAVPDFLAHMSSNPSSSVTHRKSNQVALLEYNIANVYFKKKSNGKTDFVILHTNLLLQSRSFDWIVTKVTPL